jgi:hypothetical protein
MVRNPPEQAMVEAAIVLVWCVAWAVICAVIAQSNGHSGCNGALGGCLFGVFALIYWLVVKDKNREQIDYRHRYSQWQHNAHMRKMAEMQTRHQAEMQRQLDEIRKRSDKPPKQ